MLKLKSFTFNNFLENTYLLYDETKACAILDPGCLEQDEKDKLHDFIQRHELQIVQLLITHGHIDHVLGNQYVKDTYQVPLALHRIEAPMLRTIEAYAPQYGIIEYKAVEADTLLEEGDQIKFGKVTLEVLHVPGHSPGHIAFYDKESQVCLSGDVLFRGSIGRTDLTGGDHATLIRSIQEKIFPLGDSVVIYPGHGAKTTVGEEKRTNPFCKL